MKKFRTIIFILTICAIEGCHLAEPEEPKPEYNFVTSGRGGFPDSLSVVPLDTVILKNELVE